MGELRRPIGTTNFSLPPIVWRVSGSEPAAEILAALREVRWTTFFLPAGTHRPSWLQDADELIVGVSIDQLRRRGVPTIAAGGRCPAVMLERASGRLIKEGWPMHRLGRWRDHLAASLMGVMADDALEAEWLADNTPARLLFVPYGLDDLSADYRATAIAEEAGMAVVAMRPAAVWVSNASEADRLRFLFGEFAVTSVLLDLPRDVVELATVRDAIESPMPADEREAWRSRFRAAVPPPAALSKGHPPEYGT